MVRKACQKRKTKMKTLPTNKKRGKNKSKIRGEKRMDDSVQSTNSKKMPSDDQSVANTAETTKITEPTEKFLCTVSSQREFLTD